jgi:hypothetical protein
VANIEKKLKEMCESNPNRPQQVVITLSDAASHLTAADLGLIGAEKIGEGILKGSFRGDQLLELEKRVEVDEIISDFEIGIL